MTQTNLGNALMRVGERESGIERLTQAVSAYQEALKEFTQEHSSYYYYYDAAATGLEYAKQAIAKRKGIRRG